MSTEQPIENKNNICKTVNENSGGCQGDFSQRMPLEYSGMAGKIADTLDIIELNQRMAEVRQDQHGCR